MLAKEFKPQIDRIVRTIAAPLLRDNRPRLTEYLALSLAHRTDPWALMDLQERLVKEVVGLQEIIRDHRANGDERQADAHERLLHCVKQIADGIAWRSLHHDRGLIHELAWKNSTGFIEKTSIDAEIQSARECLDRYQAVTLINDLTNFLRYGDLTVVAGDVIYIGEVKAGRGSRRSSRASTQRRVLLDFIEFANSRSRIVNGRTESLIRLNTKPKGHIEALPGLISDARGRGFSYARVSDALAVNVLCPDALVAAGADFNSVVANPFHQVKRTVVYNSYEWFRAFSPNLSPFSVFPLAADERVALMTGEVCLLVYVNVMNVVRALRRRGLKATIPSDSEIRALPSDLKPGQVREHELAVAIRVSDGTKQIHMPISEFNRLGQELLDEDCWAEAVEERLAVVQAGQESFAYFDFADEASRWD